MNASWAGMDGGMMAAWSTFEELRDFWRSAYSALNIETGDVESTLKNWVSSVLTNDGVDTDSPIRSLFSFKPPEPFFGHWVADDGSLSVAN